ncbi:MAG: hypothetical protein IKW30_10500 [Lachnospiraceae bacterium]|nr:hypothetical protein [Lachnospiraceae bacterium]
MKEKNTKNLKLKIIAVLFATSLWMISININDPYQSKDYTVSVQLLNMNSMNSAGKYVEVVNGSDVISVRVRGNRSVMDSFGVNNITATADLNEMDGNNRVPIKLSTVKTSGSKIESVRSNDSYVEVKVEEIKRIQKRLEVITKNAPGDGYILGKVTTEQNALKISGPESAVALVDKAVVNFDLANATDDVSMLLPVELYDAEGNRIQDHRLTTSINEVQCLASILTMKEVPVVVTVKGEAAKGYGFTEEILCEPSSVWVAAKASQLRGLKQLEIEGAVDIQGATKDVVTTLELREYLPENVIVADSSTNGKVEVIAKIEETFTKNIEVEAKEIQIVNVPEGIKAEHQNKEKKYTVEVTGFLSKEKELDPQKLKAKVDILGYMNKKNMLEILDGTYDMDVIMEFPEGVWLENEVRAEIKLGKK